MTSVSLAGANKLREPYLAAIGRGFEDVVLRDEAAQHGDEATVKDCDRANRGSKAAARRLAAIIAEAQAMAEAE